MLEAKSALYEKLSNGEIEGITYLSVAFNMDCRGSWATLKCIVNVTVPP